MTRDELKARIKTDIAEQSNFSGHGIAASNVAEHLVEPFQQTFVTANDEKIECWVVLEEIPGGDGYLVVYNEDEDLFGLASNTSLISETHGLLTGFYGPSFVDPIINM